MVTHASGWSSGRDRPWRLAHSWHSQLVYARIHFTQAPAALMAAFVLMLAPLARIGEAIAVGRVVVARDAAAAWLILLRLLTAMKANRHRRAQPDGPFIRAAAELPRQE